MGFIVNSQPKKLLYVLFPFIVLIISLIVINLLSMIESDPLDTIWTTRQLVIGLFIFVGFTFIPGFLQLSFRNSLPWFFVSLSHHSGSMKNHELVYKNHSICAGCFGSTLSIFLSNTCLLLYFFFPSSFDRITPSVLLVIGFILILVTYSRYFTTFSARIRLVQHSTLFFGLSFLIIAEDMIFQSALFIVLLLPSWISFLLKRVKLSKEKHSKS
ncbi:hypothetical protein CEE45_09395 [Candidatus Heimdallarchaeota archaeon B3_Heim]|nr:MAG: hypothetical protein CEE45_09395 [Candidatus Heimdallarchaeota archaeon B3_Heim]